MLGRVAHLQKRVSEAIFIADDRIGHAPFGRPLRFTHDGTATCERTPSDQLMCAGCLYTGAEVILLVRDPRDLLVSSYFQATRREDGVFAGALSDFIRSKRFGAEKVARFHDFWLRRSDHVGRRLVLQYEELRRAPITALRTILQMLDAPYPARHLRDAVEFARFDNMRQLEEMDCYKCERLRPGHKSDPESFKTRRGTVGGFQQYLSPEDQDYVQGAFLQLPDGRAIWRFLTAATPS